MSDPIPEDQQDQNLPTNAEDRRAAAALSSLNTNEDPTSASKLPSTDQKTLDNAMSRLEIAAGKSGGGKSADVKNPPPAQRAAAEAKKKASVKVSAEDVGLLVDALDLNKAKATELLKTHDGDVRKAVGAYIAVGV